VSRVAERPVAKPHEPIEVLIPEARQRARHRRTVIGLVLLGALIVITAVLVAIGSRGNIPKRTASYGPGSAVITGVTTDNVADLAGANTMIASGSHAWVTIMRESTTSSFFAVTELNVNNGTLVRVIKNKPGSALYVAKNQRVGDLTEPGPMAVSGSHLWIANDQYWNVTELNASNGSLVRVISAKADELNGPGPMAVSGSHVWVSNGHVGANSITELNASNGSLVRVISAKADELNGPGPMAVSGSHVFVLNAAGDSITELNASSGALVRVINARAGCCAPRSGTFEWAGPTALTVSGPHLWVADLHNYANGATSVSSVAEFNVSDGSLVRVIKAKADGFNFPRSIAVSQGHVWVLNGDNTLTELNASNGSLVRVINVKLDSKRLNSADGLAISGPHVLVLNIYSGQKGSVTVINASNGTLVRVIQ
jgi:outer membrane protein assembly factor BamB